MATNKTVTLLPQVPTNTLGTLAAGDNKTTTLPSAPKGTVAALAPHPFFDTTSSGIQNKPYKNGSKKYYTPDHKEIDIYAPVDGVIGDGSTVLSINGKSAIEFHCTQHIGIFNQYRGFVFLNATFVKNITYGTVVTRGQKIGTTIGGYVDLQAWQLSKGKLHTRIDPAAFVDSAEQYSASSVGSPATNTTGTTGTNLPSTDSDAADMGIDVGSIAKAAAFSTFFQMPGIFDTAESQALTGQRSLMNDQPLMPFIEQLCGACLRQFMSTPSGDFFAFYPDYFGGLGKTAYWLIDDIEIINGSIELSDENLYTHVYVVGDIAGPPATAGMGGDNQVNMLDRISTGGVVTVFNAFMADFLNGTDQPAGIKVDSTKYPTLAEKSKAIAFLQKYGARPYYEPQVTVRAPIYESFLAYQKFCLSWAEQFKTSFEFTFMPELFPGGIVAFPEHGLQCYVASVSHNCSYETGFTTTAELMAPSAYKGADGEAIDPDKSWVHAGMIRSWPVDKNVTHFSGTTETDPAKNTKSGNN
jgi:hypothetical protein